MKTLNFDAQRVTMGVRDPEACYVEIKTEYPDEVLHNFTPEEIMQNYADIDKLYGRLKEFFE